MGHGLLPVVVQDLARRLGPVVSREDQLAHLLIVVLPVLLVVAAVLL
jgi:hypothetical protein